MKAVYGAIQKLVEYAKEHLMLEPRNACYVRNTVLGIVGAESFEDVGAVYRGEKCSELIRELVNACVAEKLFDLSDAEGKADAVMGALSLLPKEVEDRFSALMKKSSKTATDWLYDYSVRSDYVKKEKLDANPRFERNGLIVTINLAKPEFRDPKNAASGNATKGGYPACTICRENEGFFGRSKRTLRTVSLKLGGKDWFWQFSPYGYFFQHGIAVNCEHTPMHVERQTFDCLMDFVDLFPHWFIGCNAPLPRIGGSVLAHDHFQGGGENLPLHTAQPAIEIGGVKGATVSVLDWPGTAIRIASKDRKTVADLSEKIRLGWLAYRDEARGIIPEDKDGVHSAISPTVVKRGNCYEMTIILRNNITSERYPDGVFHAHPEFHIIKKESIGLIEAQGLFILPGRLVEQLGKIQALLVAGAPLTEELSEFGFIYRELSAMRKTFTEQEAEEAVRDELASVCYRILQNTAVFESHGETAKFIGSLGLK